MKRASVILLAISLLLTLSACSNGTSTHSASLTDSPTAPHIITRRGPGLTEIPLEGNELRSANQIAVDASGTAYVACMYLYDAEHKIFEYKILKADGLNEAYPIIEGLEYCCGLSVVDDALYVFEARERDDGLLEYFTLTYDFRGELLDSALVELGTFDAPVFYDVRVFQNTPIAIFLSRQPTAEVPTYVYNLESGELATTEVTYEQGYGRKVLVTLSDGMTVVLEEHLPGWESFGPIIDIINVSADIGQTIQEALGGSLDARNLTAIDINTETGYLIEDAGNSTSELFIITDEGKSHVMSLPYDFIEIRPLSMHCVDQQLYFLVSNTDEGIKLITVGIPDELAA